VPGVSPRRSGRRRSSMRCRSRSSIFRVYARSPWSRHAAGRAARSPQDRAADARRSSPRSPRPSAPWHKPASRGMRSQTTRSPALNAATIWRCGAARLPGPRSGGGLAHRPLALDQQRRLEEYIPCPEPATACPPGETRQHLARPEDAAERASSSPCYCTKGLILQPTRCAFRR
jgi:hypothetical protein